MEEVLDSIDFTCGDELLPDEERYTPFKVNKISVDRRKKCSHPVETHYYSVYTDSPVCSACNRSLEVSEVTLYNERKKK